MLIFFVEFLKIISIIFYYLPTRYLNMLRGIESSACCVVFRGKSEISSLDTSQSSHFRLYGFSYGAL